MSILGLLLLVLLIMVLLGAVPVGDSRNVVLTILILIIVLWLCGAMWGPLSYSSRGVYWP